MVRIRLNKSQDHNYRRACYLERATLTEPIRLAVRQFTQKALEKHALRLVRGCDAIERDAVADALQISEKDAEALMDSLVEKGLIQVGLRGKATLGARGARAKVWSRLVKL